MAIAFRAAGTLATGTGATLTPGLPAGTASGDFLLATISSKNTSTIPNISLSGWTRIGYGNRRAQITQFAFYKFAGPGESDPTFNNADSGALWGVAIAGYTGVDTTTPVEQTPMSFCDGVQQTIVPRFPRTQSDNAWMITCASTTDDNALALSVDQGFSTRIGGGTYDVNGLSLGLADIEVASQGTVTAPTWNQAVNSPDHYATLQFSLRASGEAQNASYEVEFLDSTNYYSGTSAITVLLPNRQVGDVMLLSLAARTNIAGTFTVTGWTMVPGASATVTSASVLNEVWYRFCDGSEADSLSVSYSTAATGVGAVTASFSHVDPADLLDPSVATTNGNSTTMTPAAVTTTLDGTMVVPSLFTSDDNENSLSTANSFTSYAEGGDFDISTSLSYAGAFFRKASAGLVTMPEFTQTLNASDSWVAITVPLQELSPGITGDGASTLEDVTSDGDGTFTPPAITGTGSSTLEDVTSAGSGTYTPGAITGTGSSTLADVTSAGSGTFTGPITGTGASTLEDVTSAGQGFLGVNGTGSSTLGDVTSSGTGVYTPPAITGTGSSTLGDVTSVGTGTFQSGVGLGSVVCDVLHISAECVVLGTSAECQVLAPMTITCGLRRDL